MRKIFIRFFVGALIVSLSGCGSDYSASKLEKSLRSYVKDKDCRIGVAVIYDGDTVSVNGGEKFPMLSVYKFPQAIAVARVCYERGMTPGDSIGVCANEIHPDTYSPMRERYGKADMSLSVGELLGYTLMMSDNNACDILFRLIGGTEVADSVIKSMGYDDVSVVNTEEEMNTDYRLCNKNSATPISLASMMNDFHDTIGNSSEWMRTVKLYLESCQTGMNRIPGAKFSAETLIGHKTGTGPKDESGRIMAVNDVGYVEFVSGKSYAIAVMVAQSPMNMEDTEAVIGDISEIVRRSIGEE